MATIKQNYYTLYKATSPSEIVYQNVDILCSDMDLIKGSVLAVCTKIRNSCYGYKFEYVTGGGL